MWTLTLLSCKVQSRVSAWMTFSLRDEGSVVTVTTTSSGIFLVHHRHVPLGKATSPFAFSYTQCGDSSPYSGTSSFCRLHDHRSCLLEHHVQKRSTVSWTRMGVARPTALRVRRLYRFGCDAVTLQPPCGVVRKSLHELNTDAKQGENSVSCFGVVFSFLRQSVRSLRCFHAEFVERGSAVRVGARFLLVFLPARSH